MGRVACHGLVSHPEGVRGNNTPSAITLTVTFEEESGILFIALIDIDNLISGFNICNCFLVVNFYR